MDLSSVMIFLIIVMITVIIGYVVFDIQPEEASEEMKVTQSRLKKIKNKEYDTKATVVKEASSKGLMTAILSDNQYRIAILGTFLDKFNVFIKIKKALKLADIKMDITQFISTVVVAGVVVSALTFVFLARGNLIVVAVMFLLITIVLPMFVIKMKMKKRLAIFTSQLPDALGLISSSLRAGHSLPSAFSIVVQELGEPISAIFKTACEDINLGRSTKEALDGMVDNMPESIDLRFFVTAVLIQREIGGNLAEILDNLNDTIRERFKLLGQLKAQTAQASLSGIVLALAPLFIGGIIYLLNPQYMSPLFDNFLGQMAIGTAVFLGVVGFLIIRKITNIKV
ncbi:MAG: type II secretion system F family protein [Cyanobacteriota bacterium]